MANVPERERPYRINVLLVTQGAELGALAGAPISAEAMVALVEGLIEVIVDCDAGEYHLTGLRPKFVRLISTLDPFGLPAAPEQRAMTGRGEAATR